MQRITSYIDLECFKRLLHFHFHLTWVSSTESRVMMSLIVQMDKWAQCIQQPAHIPGQREAELGLATQVFWKPVPAFFQLKEYMLPLKLILKWVISFYSFIAVYFKWNYTLGMLKPKWCTIISFCLFCFFTPEPNLGRFLMGPGSLGFCPWLIAPFNALLLSNLTQSHDLN